jgi:pilus assembly protein CpaE
MDPSSIVSAVLISPRREVREAIRAHLQGRNDVRLDVELTNPVTPADAGYLEDLRVLAPGVVLLDLGEDAGPGLAMAQLLADHVGSGRVFGFGPPASPDLLLQAMRAGVSEYFTLPLDPAAFDAALDCAARRAAPAPSQAGSGRVLAFFATKGGSGATMVATNTAVALARAGRRVVLVDLDLEMGDVGLFLGLKPRYDVLELAKNLHRMDENLLLSYLVEHPSGVRLLPAPANPERTEGLTPEQVRQIFNFLKQRFEIVVVDTSNALYDYTLSAFDQADRICLVANVDLPSLRNTQRCFHVLARLGYGREATRMIVNRYQPRGPIRLEAVEQTLNVPAFHVISNDYAGVIHAINAGEPLGPGAESPVRGEIEALAEALAADVGLARPRAARVEAGGAGGVLGGLLRRFAPAGGRGAAAAAANGTRGREGSAANDGLAAASNGGGAREARARG